MTKEIWLNLPVKNIEKSRAFFSALGFKLNEKNGNTDTSACFLMGAKNTVLMLFSIDTFEHIVRHKVSDPNESSQMLISFDAESKQEVDDIAQKVETAGGNVFAKPTEIQGWMYGCAFADLDGHRWNVLYMDKNQIP